MTNLAKEVMSYMGFPFHAELQSFITHAQVLDYLTFYAGQYQLLPLINLGCKVESVRPVSPVGTVGGADNMGVDGPLWRWEVVYQQEVLGSDRGGSRGLKGKGAMTNTSIGNVVESDTTSGRPITTTTVKETFDSVCVCNGHFTDPFTPMYEGADGFRGTTMHARAYDRPDTENFQGKRVLVVGTGYSGSDIAREVSSTGGV